MSAGNKKHIEKQFTGKQYKKFIIKSGKTIRFTIDTKLLLTKPEHSTHTIIKVDGNAITDQTQSGTDVNFRFEFKLP